MNSLPPDPLVTLWKTAPKADTHNLLQALRDADRQHQRLNRTVLGILCGIALLLMFEEATGRVATKGALSAIWISVIVLGVVWQRRARCNRSHAFEVDTVSLLKVLIARAKRDLFIARSLYAGVPFGTVVGWIIAELTGISRPPVASQGDPRLHVIQTGAGVIALIVMIAAGAVLARARHRQVQELNEKLRSIESDV